MAGRDEEIRMLKHLNARLAEAEITRNTDELDRLLADDYLGVDPSGALLTKAKIIKTYGAGDVQLESIVSSDLHIRIMDDTGIITGRSLIKGKTPAGEFLALFRYIDVYRRAEPEWKLVSSQLTPLVGEGPLMA